MPQVADGGLVKKYRADFVGGVNLYLGARQIQDNESPNALNCDFKGKGGIGNRQGFTQLGVAGAYNKGTYGMNEFHTPTIDYLVKFVSNGSNIVLSYSNNGGSTWSDQTGTTFTDVTNMDSCVAGGFLFTGNGVDAMKQWDGTNWSVTTNGAVVLYPTYFNQRIWGVDPSNPDTIKFSGQYATSSSRLGDFTTANHGGTVTIFPGSGCKVTGLANFKDNLYVFLNGSVKGIFKIAPSTTADTFTVNMVTNTIGCVSHRSITQIENDLYFAADNGVYSLGEVSTFVSVRATNLSLRVQNVFTNMSGANKAKLVGRYFNYKYHLFYSLFGSSNDSCLAYDIRYQAWQDWRNIAANDATPFIDSTKTSMFYFGHPSTSAVYQLYSGSTDDGATITSSWYSKSFDEGQPDMEKLYLDSTFVFGALTGSVTVSVIFNDSETTVTKALTQQTPQGGYGRGTFGRSAFGKNVNTTTVTQVVSQPERLRAKGQKFAVQYLVTSSGSWRLDTISQTFLPFGHYKFPSSNKLN